MKPQNSLMHDLGNIILTLTSLILILGLESPAPAQEERELKEMMGLLCSSGFDDYISNEYIAIAIDDSYALFTVGCTGGDPENPNDDGEILLYGHPWPWSSFSTLRVDGSDAVYGSSSGSFTLTPTNYLTYDKSVWVWGDIQVTQVLSLVANPFTGRVDSCQIRYQLTNLSASDTHDVGLRILLDTMLGPNDGAPFRVPGVGNVTTEQEFTGTDVPDYFQSFDDLADPDVVSQGTQRGGQATAPDRLILVSWPDFYDTLWAYTVTAGKIFGSTSYPDSAVGLYWNPESLGPGQTIECVTYYGLTGWSEEVQPELVLTVSAPLSLDTVDDEYSPNPFTVMANVQNTSDVGIDDIAVQIELPPEGLTLEAGSTAVQTIAHLGPGQIESVSWSVRAAIQTQERTFTYTVRASAPPALETSVDRNVTVGAIAFDIHLYEIYNMLYGTELTSDNDLAPYEIPWDEAWIENDGQVTARAIDAIYTQNLGYYTDLGVGSQRNHLFTVQGDQAFLSGPTATFVVGGLFGFYDNVTYTGVDDTWYSEKTLNHDSNYDHLRTYFTPVEGEYLLAWEDLHGGGDMDHTDLVAVVTGAEPFAGAAEYDGAFRPNPDGYQFRNFGANELYTDTNGNSRYDLGEPFTDTNGDGQWGGLPWALFRDTFGPEEVQLAPNGRFDGRYEYPEDWQDLNSNGRYDAGEPFIYADFNGNGLFDPTEPYTDINQNGTYDAGEPFTDESQPLPRAVRWYWNHFRMSAGGCCFGMSTTSYVLYQNNVRSWNLGANRGSIADPLGIWGTITEFIESFQARWSDVAVQTDYRSYDDPLEVYSELRKRMAWGADEWSTDPWVLSVWWPNEPYVDGNGNGRYDLGEQFTDLNQNGRWNQGGAHAISPYMITEAADLTAEVHVYDSNDPGDDSRIVNIDLFAGTARYATYGLLSDVRLTSLSAAQAEPQMENYDVVTGPAHLLYTDPAGNHLGYVSGGFFSDIAGTYRVVAPMQNDTNGRPEAYYVPADLDVVREFCGTANGVVSVSVSRPTGLAVAEVTISEGSVHQMGVAPDGLSTSLIAQTATSSATLSLDTEWNEEAIVVQIGGLTLSGGEAIGLSFTPDVSAVIVGNDGDSKNYWLQLERLGPFSGIWESRIPIHIPAGATDYIAPLQWDDISSSSVVLDRDLDGDGFADETFVLPALVDSTDSTQTKFGRMRYNRATAMATYEVSLTNTSQSPLATPLIVVVQEVSPSTVTVANAHGTTSDGKTYFDYSTKVGPDGELTPGETSASTTWQIHNPTRARWSCTITVWSGRIP